MNTAQKKRLDRLPKLKKVTASSNVKFSEKELGSSLSKMAKSLEKSGLSGQVVLNIKEGRKFHNRALSFAPNTSHVANDGQGATLELSLDAETYQKIISGELAPFGAMLLDKLHVHGSCQFARSVYVQLSGKSDIQF